MKTSKWRSTNSSKRRTRLKKRMKKILLRAASPRELTSLWINLRRDTVACCRHGVSSSLWRSILSKLSLSLSPRRSVSFRRDVKLINMRIGKHTLSVLEMLLLRCSSSMLSWFKLQLSICSTNLKNSNKWCSNSNKIKLVKKSSKLSNKRQQSVSKTRQKTYPAKK